ncbi:MAG: MmgE/PrpD family protein [Betaproteobacteria bacterium]|nr:MmgE/PrpD family protein [Betaproteobacteria bacterium]
MGTEIAQRLAEFTHRTRLEDIPQGTVEFTKGLCLKTVAGMLRGSMMPAGLRASNSARERGHAPEVSVIGSGFRTSLWNAVLNHAFFAHASELEDDRFGGLGTCWDITVLPVTFTFAEKLKLSGRELVELSAIGLEVHARTCLFYPQGYMGMTVIPGAMGPAAAAARALKLGVPETVAALGLSMSSPPIAYASFGTDSHYFESAMQSLQGLIAAELAQQGASGNPDIVTFMTNLIGKDKVKPEKFLENLGSDWFLNAIWIKKYPCCFYMHRYLDAFLDLLATEKLVYEQIEKVRVHISQVERCCDRPDPKTFDDLQFSFHHSHGVAMIDRDVNFSHISDAARDNPRYREARAKVEVVFHPEWASAYAMGTPAQLEVMLGDGRRFSREKNHVIGSPTEPLTMEQFKALFVKFTRDLLPEADLRWTVDALANLERLDRGEVEKLMHILVRTGKLQ